MGRPKFRLLSCAAGALLALGPPAFGPILARAYTTTALYAPSDTNTALPHGSTTEQMLASGTPSTSAAASGWTQGIDVASYQHPNGSGIDWGQVGAAGYQFVFVKATQGTYYVNPYFSGDFAGAHSAGLFRAAYHFADPSVSDGATQADYMLNTNSYVADGATFPPALDLEDVTGQPFCYGLSTSAMVDWISQFGNEVQRRIGRPPVIYSRASWWNQCTGSSAAFGANALWVASFGTSSPTLPSGWSSWTFWQWTSTGSVPGITGDVDISYFAGGTSQLTSFSAHAYAKVSTANGRLADFNGDGINDVVNFQQGSDAAVFVALSTGSSLSPPTRWNPWGPFCYSGATPLVGDFNGDGRADIACAQQGSDGAIFVALSTGSGFGFPTRWNPWGPFCYGGDTPIVGHFAHPRIPGTPVVDDIACVQQGSDGAVFVAASNGSSFDLPTRWNSWGSYCYSGATPVAGDFDGDGRTDLACDLQSTDGSVLIAASTGSAFNPPSRWNSWGPFCYTGSTPLAGDFNGDGRDDLACDQQSSDGAIFVTTSTVTSTGPTLNPPSRWNPGFPFCYTGMTARATKLSSAPGGDGMVCFTQGTAGDVWFTSSSGSAFGNLAKWNAWGPFSGSGHTPV